MARGILTLSAAALLVGVSSQAMAGGFSRGTADTDILFEDGNFNMRSGVTIVSPERTYSENPNPALEGTEYADTYVIPSFALKYQLGEGFACAGTAVQAYGAGSTYAAPTVTGKLDEDFEIMEFGTTCAAFIPVGPGHAFLLGGVFVEQFDYDLQAVIPVAPGVFAPLGIELDSTAAGWRAGLGYEIPSIALRAQVLYRSGTEHDADGTGSTPVVPIALDAFGTGDLPQSVELRVQSGIAPGWLVFGNVKWTDWSVNEQLVLTVPGLGLATTNNYFWRDGWTVTAGVGHVFNETVSGLASFTWDRGVSTGFDYYGDTYTAATGVSLNDRWGGQFRAGAALSYQGEVSAPEDFGGLGGAIEDGWAVAGQIGYSIRW